MDGWSESAQVVDYLIELQEVCNCIFIKGNHDAWCELWLKGEEAGEQWLFHGGRSTVRSYAGRSAQQRQVHIEFFSRLQHYFVDSLKRLFIHAGFSSMHANNFCCTLGKVSIMYEVKR